MASEKFQHNMIDHDSCTELVIVMSEASMWPFTKTSCCGLVRRHILQQLHTLWALFRVDYVFYLSPATITVYSQNIHSGHYLEHVVSDFIPSQDSYSSSYNES